MGVENILKRIIRHYRMEMPEGDDWHVQLFRQFRPPVTEPLPVLFPDALAERMKPFRGFRHVIRHGYSRDLEWEHMRVGLTEAKPVVEHFREQVEVFLSDLDEKQ